MVPFNSSLKAVVQVWARREPSAAMMAVSTLSSDKLITELHHSIISVWAESDPRGLLEYTENMSIESREFGLEKAIIGIASEAPKEAAQLIERLNNNGAKTRTRQAIVAKLIAQDIHEALDWVLECFEEREEQRYLLTFIWPGLVDTMPNSLCKLRYKSL